MGFKVEKVQVWSGQVSDRPGEAAGKLEILARAGADLEFVFTKPQKNDPEASILFLAPIKGEEQAQAARSVGLAPEVDIVMLCVEGDDRPGLGCDLMSALAVANINLRGLSISAVGDRFAAYLAFDSPESARMARQVLANMT